MSDDEASRAAPVDRTRTHGARFSAGVDGGASQGGVVKLACRRAHQAGFGVGGAVTVGHLGIARLKQPVAAPAHQYRAVWHVAAASRLEGQCDCMAQVSGVSFVEGDVDIRVGHG